MSIIVFAPLKLEDTGLNLEVTQLEVKQKLCDLLDGFTLGHVTGTVANAGTPVTVIPPSDDIKSFVIQNPIVGPNKNDCDAVLLISFDGGTSYLSIQAGGSFSAENIKVPSFKLDAVSDGTNYEGVIDYG